MIPIEADADHLTDPTAVRWQEPFREGHPVQETTFERTERSVLSEQELSRLDAYWRAANYLSVGQIYLLDNPLLTSDRGQA